MSYMLQILGKFIIFKDLQMIEKSLFDIFNHIKVRKNAPSLHLQVSPRTLWLRRYLSKRKVAGLSPAADTEFYNSERQVILVHCPGYYDLNISSEMQNSSVLS